MDDCLKQAIRTDHTALTSSMIILKATASSIKPWVMMMECLLRRNPKELRPRYVENHIRLDMYPMELVIKWPKDSNPSSKTIAETKRSVEDFIDFVGDIPAREIPEDCIRSQLER